MMGPDCELASDSSGFVTNWASGSFASCPAWYRKLMFQRKVPLSSVTNAYSLLGPYRDEKVFKNLRKCKSRFLFSRNHRNLLKNRVVGHLLRVYLEHEIEHQTHDHHKKMLLKYLATPRYEGPEVDQLMAGDDARALYKAGEKRLGTNEKTFIRIFCERSIAHLVAISEAHLRLYERPLEKAVKHETSGHFEYTLVTVLNCVENPAEIHVS
ncbi:hypothetical protein POM88_023544 [Heracleum sosnowskyi]|uniref:Uncharacterized protein n=1 Tax=Heracleum sosnowskyi TaxID=360622 RepID=A0AAD8IH88_9APIA|nr:hypothetical protein POM88_023544 [Heracleum sosnowskyi]